MDIIRNVESASLEDTMIETAESVRKLNTKILVTVLDIVILKVVNVFYVKIITFWLVMIVEIITTV